MSQCPYFQVWRKEIARRASSTSAELSAPQIKVSYCSHEQSPMTLEMAQHELGDGGSLKCAGFVRRCPLPEGVRPVPPALENIRAEEPVKDMPDAFETESVAERPAKRIRRRARG